MEKNTNAMTKDNTSSPVDNEATTTHTSNIKDDDVLMLKVHQSKTLDFEDTEPVARKNLDVRFIALDKLIPFKNHPFQLYEGQRKTDMVESIRVNNGVYTPIIVRPIKNGNYEILSGHNRVEATREAELTHIPAIIRDGLSDDEAMLIVTETNLIQRSYADLRHSERAIALTTHYNAMKMKSGYRTDLLKEIDELTCAPVGHGSKTRDKVGAQYGLGTTTVARYLRINNLIPALKCRLDDNGIGMRAAEALSYLRENEQEIVEDILVCGKKISIKQADTLKAESVEGKLNKTFIRRVFELGFFPTKVKPVKLSGDFLSQHFNSTQTTEEIEQIIAEALENYLSSKNI